MSPLPLLCFQAASGASEGFRLLRPDFGGHAGLIMGVWGGAGWGVFVWKGGLRVQSIALPCFLLLLLCETCEADFWGHGGLLAGGLGLCMVWCDLTCAMDIQLC